MSRSDCEALWARIAGDTEIPSWEHVSGLLEVYVGLIVAHAEHRDLISRSQQNPEAIWEHVYDSLHALELLRSTPASRLLDAGSGNGLPGIPLAVALPDRQVCLVDRSSSKQEFLELAAATLKLRNVRVVCGAVDLDLVRSERPELITMRALKQPSLFDSIPGIESFSTRWLIYATEQNVTDWADSAARAQLTLNKRVDYGISDRHLRRALLLFEPG